MRLKELRIQLNLPQKEICKAVNIPQNTYSQYENNKREPDYNTLLKLANYFNVSVDYLIGRTAIANKPEDFPPPRTTEDYTTFPVIGDIAAGFDKIAVEDWNGETIDIPNSYLKGRKKEEFFVLSVKGDSMYPLYQDGDKVLVLKQSTLNYSGDIGAVLYDDDKATLKKVEFVKGENWLSLVPINPLYKPQVIEGEELEHCRVIGIPKLLIREL